MLKRFFRAYTLFCNVDNATSARRPLARLYPTHGRSTAVAAEPPSCKTITHQKHRLPLPTTWVRSGSGQFPSIDRSIDRKGLHLMNQYQHNVTPLFHGVVQGNRHVEHRKKVAYREIFA